MKLFSLALLVAGASAAALQARGGGDSWGYSCPTVTAYVTVTTTQVSYKTVTDTVTATATQVVTSTVKGKLPPNSHTEW